MNDGLLENMRNLKGEVAGLQLKSGFSDLAANQDFNLLANIVKDVKRQIGAIEKIARENGHEDILDILIRG